MSPASNWTSKAKKWVAASLTVLGVPVACHSHNSTPPANKFTIAAAPNPVQEHDPLICAFFPVGQV